MRRLRRPQRARPPVVVVAAPPGRRRRQAPAQRPGASSMSQETFVFSKDSLAGNASGVLTFGPSLTDCAAFSSGILKAYHEYRITMVLLEYITEASSTAYGSIAYELDPHCKITSLSSTVNKFGVTKNGRRSFSRRQINGTEWHDATEDQFRILYKGNGDSKIAGSFRVTIRVETQNPK